MAKDEDEARRMAEHWTPEAVETLYEIMRDRMAAAPTRLSAAIQIITISGINRQQQATTTSTALTATTGG